MIYRVENYLEGKSPNMIITIGHKNYVIRHFDKNISRSISGLRIEYSASNRVIEPQALQNVIENLNRRVEVCRSARRGHMAGIIFCT